MAADMAIPGHKADHVTDHEAAQRAVARQAAKEARAIDEVLGLSRSRAVTSATGYSNRSPPLGPRTHRAGALTDRPALPRMRNPPLHSYTQPVQQAGSVPGGKEVRPPRLSLVRAAGDAPGFRGSGAKTARGASKNTAVLRAGQSTIR